MNRCLFTILHLSTVCIAAVCALKVPFRPQGLTSTYCEGSIVGVPDKSMLYFGNPSEHGRRANFSIHSSTDGNIWKSVSHSDFGLRR